MFLSGNGVTIERVMIFIDGSNLLYACKGFDTSFKIDYLKLRDVLTRGRKLIRPYYYGSFDPRNPEKSNRQEQFHRFLQHNGFHTVVKPLRRRGDRDFEKGVDVALVTDMLSLGYKNAYDTAILVSGDSDYVRAIEELKSLGKRIEVAIFRNSISDELRRIADEFIALDDLADRIRKD